MKRIQLITIILICGCLVGLLVGVCKSTTIIYTQREQLSQASARVNMLEIDIIAKQHIIKDLRADNLTMSADIDRLNTHTIAADMMIVTLKNKFAAALRFIEMAEYILDKQGIDYIYAGER